MMRVDSFRCARLVAVGLLGAALALPGAAWAQVDCARAPLAVQVLGSGGPYAGGVRASTGYLVWQNGRAVVMVDTGGGTFLRFGEAGARLQDLSLVAVSHLHPDHVADLPALLWLSEQIRSTPLNMAGPTGAGAFPAFDTFIGRLFDSQRGAFPILGGTLGQTGQGVRVEAAVVDADASTPQAVWAGGGIEVTAMGVPHGNVPTLAYRVQVGERSVVFGGDQNGSNPAFARFIAGADVLVMHLALSDEATGPVTALHAKPATVGEVARAAKARRLVLSHLIEAPRAVATPEWFSLSGLEAAMAAVRAQFSGPVDAAVDLTCVPIP